MMRRMISHLKGIVDLKGVSYAVIDVNGIGYKVYMTSNLLVDLTVGQEAKFPTYLAVREDALDLYGFRHNDESVSYTHLRAHGPY